jgi:hypothetical protein
MKNKKKIVLLLVLITSITIGYSQDDKLKRNEFGCHIGSTTGMGLSYRHWLGNEGFQITAVPIKGEFRSYYNAGLTYLHSFYHSTHIEFYGYLAGNYIYDDQKSDSWYSDGYHNEKVNLGIGPAFAFGCVVKINLMVGYGLYDIADDISTYFAGEIGLYYAF